MKITASQLGRLIRGLNLSAIHKQALLDEILEQDSEAVENYEAYDLWTGSLIGGDEALLEAMKALGIRSPSKTPAWCLNALHPLLVAVGITPLKVDKLIEVGTEYEKRIEEMKK
jgi:hypothetical protein